MAFIPVLACVQARVQWLSDGGVFAENVFYHATSSVPTETDLTDIGLAWRTWLFDHWASLVSNTWEVTSINLRAMNEAEGIAILYDTDFPVTGGVTDEAVPAQVCFTTTWSTGLVGRSARGRTYWLGFPNNSVINNNRLTDGAQSVYQGRMDLLLSAFEDDGHAIQVVSFVEGGVPRDEGRKLPALDVSVRFPLATQRSRLA